MLVFVTGATGFIGSALVRELLNSGHQVLGLARTPESATALEKAGALVHHGSLSDLPSLKSGAAKADAVAHLAFTTDFANYAQMCAQDRLAIQTIGAALAGTAKPLVVTSGTLMLPHGRLVTEDDGPDLRPAAGIAALRGASDVAALELAGRDVRVSVVRLPPAVHGEGDKGFVAMLVSAARASGASVYIGDGESRWPAVHRVDAARVYRLALEKGAAGSSFHAVGEVVVLGDVAGVIGRELGVPVVGKGLEEAKEVMGFVALPISIDNPTSSTRTREALGWSPSQAGLIADLEQGHYFSK